MGQLHEGHYNPYSSLSSIWGSPNDIRDDQDDGGARSAWSFSLFSSHQHAASQVSPAANNNLAPQPKKPNAPDMPKSTKD